MEELKEEILKYLDAHAKDKRTAKAISEGIESKPSLDDVNKELRLMQSEMLVFTDDEGQYKNREQAGVYEGRISINRAGLGFLDLEDRDSIRITDKEQNTALDGDTVLVKCQSDQTYGTVLKVLQRNKEHLIGTFVNEGHGLHFVPDDIKYQGKSLHVNADKNFTPIEGMKAVCVIKEYGIPLQLELKQTIGYKDDPGVDILSILLDHDIVAEFPDDVMEQVHGIPQEVQPAEKENRTDLTNDITVTIDGDDSKDFDDAVAVKKNDKGWELKVSIADVSHYVTVGSPLDKEALKRGCSTYVTDRVVPMLPHELSNGICSLNPHVVRLTLTCDMQVSEKGVIESYKLYPSYIRSTERMTYGNVNKILDGDEKLIRQYEHLGTLFDDLRDCADAIRKHRIEKGAISFNSSESDIKVDENGHPISVAPAHHGHAEEMIEDCMIAANVSVADFMNQKEYPCVYRVHEQPQARRLKDFVRVSELMGHKLVLGKSDIRPIEVENYLDSVKDTEEYPVLSMLLLRCMQKAKYENICVGHFGLAEEEYLHFTSPIRRYPDLIVHRMLRKYSFEGCTDQKEYAQDKNMTMTYSEQASARERASSDAEFACEDMKKAEFMQDHLGATGEGIITGVTSFGFFVELPDTVEGLVRVSALHDDYYNFDQDRMQLIGSRTRRTFRVGMKVKVICVSASKDNAEVDFGLVGKNGKILGDRRKDAHHSSYHGNDRRKPRSDKGKRNTHGRKKH